MVNIYYTEVNSLCIVLIALILAQLNKNFQRSSTDHLVFRRLLWATILMCASDMTAGIFRGSFIPGARVIIEVSNLLYFEALLIIGYLWALYVYIRLGLIRDLNSKIARLIALPLIVFTFIVVTNPITHFIFSIDANNLYVRGSGVPLHWMFSWSYLLLPSLRTAIVMKQEKNKQKRREIAPLLYFGIAPLVAGLFQMFFYGMSSTQAGITISIFVIFLMSQSSQILTDSLTGLNNRHGISRYFNDYLTHHQGELLCIMLLDMNDLKGINDRFGHMAGDRAIKSIADALRQACSEYPERLFLSRYGGDEFLIAGVNCSDPDARTMKYLIHKKIEKKNIEQFKEDKFLLDVGIGSACAVCQDMDDIEALIDAADDAMYEDKVIRKQTHRSKAKD